MPGLIRRVLRLLRAYAVIARSRVFDAAYYRENNPDLRWFGAVPLLHYVLAGHREKRNPSPYFNVEFYLEDNPDLAAAGVEPFSHYLTHGARDGRNPSVRFDTLHYVNKYTDVEMSGLNPLVHFIRHGQREGRASLPMGGELMTYAATGETRGPVRRIFFMASSYDPHTVRYRVHQLIPHLNRNGVTCAVCDETAQTGDLESFSPDVLFLCRVPCNPHVRVVVDQARRRGTAVVFDLDDLLCDPAFTGYVHFIVRGSQELFREYERLSGWLRQSLLKADLVTCSTSHLATYVARFGRPVQVVQNNLSDQILARIAHRPGRPERGPLCTIGYFSGTRSHQRDFEEAAVAVLEILRTEPHARLLIVGLLDLDARFELVRDRIEVRPRMTYEEMIDVLGMVDINLAPLETDNPFTACKSELKVFEAAAHGIPTIVSAVGATAAAIEHGRTGMVAGSPSEWTENLRLLVRNSDVRSLIGANARREIVPRFLAAEAAARALSACESAMEKSREPWRLLGAELPQVLFVSGGSPACRRYRCAHACDQLRAVGIPADVFGIEEIRVWSNLPQAKVIVLHRVPHHDAVQLFIEERRRGGAVVIFDTDDLVFVPGIEPHVHALQTMNRQDRALYSDGLRRYRQTLALCDAGIASTPAIATAMRDVVRLAFLHRNAPGRELIERSTDKPRSATRGAVVLGYLSGSATHNADFALASAALARVLEKHPATRLRLVGPVDLPAVLAPHAARIETRPLVDWRDLPREIAEMDINLAPLEDNPFCVAKSDLKWFEAALVGVPTVASRVGEFAERIRDGETGFLAATPEEWFARIEALVLDEALRRRMAHAAREVVLKNFSPEMMGRGLREILLDLLARSRDAGGLALNWYLQAPFEGSGGYTNIFRFGVLLADMGYQVRFLLEKVAHFENMPDSEVLAYVRRHFQTGKIQLIVGHDNAPPADVAIATGWPTALTVAEVQGVRRKMYFVQDYEADFYDPGSENHRRARATYDFGFRMMTLGRQLADRLLRENSGRRAVPFDFAADHEIFHPTTTRSEAPVRLIFYARPETPRRGFPTGMAALELVHRRFGDRVQIALYGSKALAEQTIPFPYENLAVLTPAELGREFSRAHIGVSFSLSNFSLVPLEMMACGCAVVELRGENTAAVIRDGDNALLADYTAEHVATTIGRLVEDRALRERIAAGGKAYADSFSWERSAATVDEYIRESLLESSALPPG